MVDELRRLRATLLEEAPEPDAALVARILANPGVPATRSPRTAALAAALLAAALVVGLVVGHRLEVPGADVVPRAVPAATPVPTALPSPPLPQEDLAAARLENVADQVQALNVTADSGGQTVELIGVYSDAVRTVFLFHGLPDLPTSVMVSDQQGIVNAASNGAPAGVDDRFISLAAPLRAGPDGNAQVTLDLLSPGGPGPASTAARWTFRATVRVGGGTTLATPAPATVGGRIWQITALEESPNAVEVVVLVHGATIDQINEVPEPLTLAGPGGANMVALDEGASITATPNTVMVQAIWLRGADGAYQLTIHTPAGNRTFPITVG